MIGFALDMDGTLYHGERPIPGASEFVGRLREMGIPFRFVTNNSSHPRRFYADRLARMGFPAVGSDVLTSAVATSRFLAENRPGKSVFLLASDEVAAEFRDSGTFIFDGRGVPDIVLLTFDRSIDYSKINTAYRYLTEGAELIATHPDDVCPTEYGYDVDIGPFIRLFESLTGKNAVVVGKPNRRMLDMAALEMGVLPSEVIMVGDRLSTDIRMAADAGVRSILVLTGETDRAMLERSAILPTYVIRSVADLDKNTILDLITSKSEKHNPLL